MRKTILDDLPFMQNFRFLISICHGGSSKNGSGNSSGNSSSADIFIPLEPTAGDSGLGLLSFILLYLELRKERIVGEIRKGIGYALVIHLLVLA